MRSEHFHYHLQEALINQEYNICVCVTLHLRSQDVAYIGVLCWIYHYVIYSGGWYS